MEVLGYTFFVGNKLGYLAFLSFIALFILYFMRPKPFKKVIPSLIFLESEQKKLSINSFFKKFVKDWLIIIQIIILLLLCGAALHLSTEVMLKKLNSEVVFVIDVSASSKALFNGKPLINSYRDDAKKRLGVKNTIVLIKNTPEILVKDTNPVNAYRVLSTIKASDSLSNIWDSMMVAADIAGPKANVVVISDFVDTNSKDLSIAKQIIEAKGLKLDTVNPRKDNLNNIGITRFSISGERAVIDVKNYDNQNRYIRIANGDTMEIPALAVEQFHVQLTDEINEISIETGDDFSVDDKITIIIPQRSKKDLLFITNKKDSFVYNAMASIKNLDLKRAEPPIITLENQQIFLLDNIDYNSILPGTIEKIKVLVKSGSSIIIIAQDGIDSSKLNDLLPVEIVQELEQQTEIINTATLSKFKDYDFGLSSRYLETRIINNNSIIVAEANDKTNSPVIVLSKYGLGNVLFYGIYDEHNPFKISTQYPLFWLSILDLLTGKEDVHDVNYKIGDIIYSNDLESQESYTIADNIGIQMIKDKKIAVNLLNQIESDLNKGTIGEDSGSESYETKRVIQKFELLPWLVIIAIIVSLFEVYILKRRGDL